MEDEIKPGEYHTPAGSYFKIHPKSLGFSTVFSSVKEPEACDECEIRYAAFEKGADGLLYVEWACEVCHLEHIAELHPGPKEGCEKCS